MVIEHDFYILEDDVSQCWMVSPLNMEIAARLINTPALYGDRDQLIRERQVLVIAMGATPMARTQWLTETQTAFKSSSRCHSSSVKRDHGAKW